MEPNDSSNTTMRPARKRAFLIYEIIFAALGALGGFLYYAFIGCNSGSCPITSNPWVSTIWGALMGYLVAGMFKPSIKK